MGRLSWNVPRKMTTIYRECTVVRCHIPGGCAPIAGRYNPLPNSPECQQSEQDVPVFVFSPSQVQHAQGQIEAAEGNMEAARKKLDSAHKELRPVKRHPDHRDDPEARAVEERNAQVEQDDWKIKSYIVKNLSPLWTHKTRPLLQAIFIVSYPHNHSIHASSVTFKLIS